MPFCDIETVVADTDLSQHLHFRLRYLVFCLETGFEDAARYPDLEEKDEFDDRSVHFIARLRGSNEWIAAARIILPTDRSLPVESLCKLTQADIAGVHGIAYQQTAEFSRLLIAPGLQQRPSPHRHRAATVSSSQPTHPKPAMLAQLIRAMATYCHDNDIPQWVFLISPALGRILRRMGIDLTEIGDPCEHRGLRFPFLTRVEQIYQALSRQDFYRDEELNQDHPYRLFSELFPSADEYAVDPRIQCFGT